MSNQGHLSELALEYNAILSNSKTHLYTNSMAVDLLRKELPNRHVGINQGTKNVWIDGVKFGFWRNYCDAPRLFHQNY